MQCIYLAIIQGEYAREIKILNTFRIFERFCICFLVYNNFSAPMKW